MSLSNLIPRLRNTSIELVTAQYRFSGSKPASKETPESDEGRQLLRGIISITASDPPAEENKLSVCAGWWYPCLGLVALLVTMSTIVLQLPNYLLITAVGIWGFLSIPPVLFTDPDRWYGNDKITSGQLIEWTVSPVSLIPFVGFGITFLVLSYNLGVVAYALWALQIVCLVFYAWALRAHLKNKSWAFFRYEASMIPLFSLIVVSSVISLFVFIDRAAVADLTLEMIGAGGLLLLIVPLAWLFVGHKLRRRIVQEDGHMAWKHRPETVPGQLRIVLFISQYALILVSAIIIALFVNPLFASLGAVPEFPWAFSQLTQSIIDEVSMLPLAVSTSLVILLCLIFWSLLANLAMWLHNLRRDRRRRRNLLDQSYSPDWADPDAPPMYTADLNGTSAVTLPRWRAGRSVIVFDTDVVAELCDEELEVLYNHEKHHIEQHHAWLLDILFKIGSLVSLQATAPFFYPARVEVNANSYAEKKTNEATRKSADRKIAQLELRSLVGNKKQPDNQRSSSEIFIKRWYHETMDLQYPGLMKT